ncbi:xanthine dehydrogenase accessory factor [Lentzea xinjiangensis]|uniref:Xanthine dehydrogenase accessory factor n=1 Tax=Lentzea xinjiangensis TaxID=402600 RepID=A0A1H9T6V9_9PSEU|nr:xanthine dehydrogenase accessory factor [Lentzea xinjiangensis]
MRDLAPTLLSWDRFAVASVVAVRGSAPRPAGAAMAVGPSGEVIGSVSGGCVEAEVYDLARTVLETSRPALATFGCSDDTAFSAGLTCGGSLDVLVQRDSPPLRAALRAALDGHPLSVRFAAEGRVFTESWLPPPRLLVFGAIDHAAAVAEIGRFLGYRVTVCDARPIFATPARFPAAHEVVVDWPHRYLASTHTDESTAVVVLTHDPKFDIPVLTEALSRPLAFVGALGSRRTHAERLSRLRAAGVPPAELTRLRSPVGLDLGGRSPSETAVSIAAELVATRCGGTGLPLFSLSTPVHRPLESHGTDLPQRRRHEGRPAARPVAGHADGVPGAQCGEVPVLLGAGQVPRDARVGLGRGGG